MRPMGAGIPIIKYSNPAIRACFLVGSIVLFPYFAPRALAALRCGPPAALIVIMAKYTRTGAREFRFSP